MTGGSIVENTAISGGGVAIEGRDSAILGNFTMNGTYALIGENIATNNGGGVFVDTLGRLRIDAGTLYCNEANDGGAIFTTLYQYADPLTNANAYSYIMLANVVYFIGNYARNGAFAPPVNPEFVGIPNSASTSVPGTENPLNNWDINFRFGGQIEIDPCDEEIILANCRLRDQDGNLVNCPVFTDISFTKITQDVDGVVFNYIGSSRFNFIITIAGEPFTGEVLIDNVPTQITNGAIILQAGDVVTIPNVPVGTAYQIVEVDIPEGWVLIAPTNGVTGEADVDADTHVFINQQVEDELEPELVSISFTKEVLDVNGEAFDYDGYFAFIMIIDSELFDGTVLVNGNEVVVVDGEISIQAGDVVTILDLEIGTEYRIEEVVPFGWELVEPTRGYFMGEADVDADTFVFINQQLSVDGVTPELPVCVPGTPGCPTIPLPTPPVVTPPSIPSQPGTGPGQQPGPSLPQTGVSVLQVGLLGAGLLALASVTVFIVKQKNRSDSE